MDPLLELLLELPPQLLEHLGQLGLSPPLLEQLGLPQPLPLPLEQQGLPLPLEQLDPLLLVEMELELELELDLLLDPLDLLLLLRCWSSHAAKSEKEKSEVLCVYIYSLA
jgi:hypothetical protein